MVIQELIRLSKLQGADEVKEFHHQRLRAFRVAAEVYAERAAAYNVDHEPFDEMPFGVVSLASEMFKRMIRMTGLVTPEREQSLSDGDIGRLEDTAIDLINYASWMFAVVQVAKRKHLLRDIAPRKVDKPKVGQWREELSSVDEAYKSIGKDQKVLIENTPPTPFDKDLTDTPKEFD